MSPNTFPEGGQHCPATVGLYVHIPFFSIKCFYCDFTAFAGQSLTVERYLRALESEARLFSPRVPTTLYIGGGTPSELSVPQISQLFDLLYRAHPASVFSEITFEANPESLDAKKLRVLNDAGVTRLSLGLQTMDAALLKAIGRKHSPEDFLKVYALARRAGGPSISVDLMYGLPGQNMKRCRDSLAAVLELEPEHLSLYGLQVEDRTLFGKRAVEVDEDLSREMFEASLGMIGLAGYRHYEISNFARPGFESRHNLIYWNNGEYIGLGCGAAAYLNGERSTNIDRLRPYCEAVERGQRPRAISERLTGKEKLGEDAFLGLRLVQGFKPGPGLEAEFAKQWLSLSERGYIQREGDRVRLTHEGLFLANQALAEFVAPFPEAAA